ncbi:RNA 3'-terminal phosphate cyclase [Tolypocladium ophioglossoides CBS 100239]|uniref:RNA 3'-terminal phosphate cyclase n=1 Tax=Tolypocladium ophioglossoides (strain CBS 100239) TaxID=1163406 RepID=A0A0L0N153_TOLOC|nr:RNA 3'-terminal phosphate cyclase [Tolypocladium ophioglossoides CBS 100239]
MGSGMKPIELDGRTGEGGGQLVRIAVGLAALTSQPVTITNVRGNRQGGQGGGLKSQHVTSITWLAEATDAHVEGLHVGSETLTFIPRQPPTELSQRRFNISADSGAASSLLVLQAILPFVLFASNEKGEPLELEISGGTNVAWSLSFEYFDQVLMPTLEERFGISVERELRKRGWSLGPQSRGSIWLRVHPVPRSQKLQYKPPPQHTFPESYEVKSIDVSIIVPRTLHEQLQGGLVKGLGVLFPDAAVCFKLSEDSGNDARWSILLMAHSSAGIRWAREVLCSMPKRTKSRDIFIAQLSNSLCRGLYEEVSQRGTVDEHLQDQVVAFQALAEGLSSFPRGDHPTEVNALADGVGGLDISNRRMRREKTHEPFGHGSSHTQTARWVASEVLPHVEFYNRGDFVKGIGYSLS